MYNATKCFRQAEIEIWLTIFCSVQLSSLSCCKHVHHVRNQKMQAKFRLAIGLAIAIICNASSTVTTTIEPSIVRVLVTSTITVLPTDNMRALEARQDILQGSVWTHSVFSWNDGSQVWSAQAPAWTQPAISHTPWTSDPTQNIVSTVSPMYSYEETHRDNTKESLANGIIFAIAFDSILVAGIIGCCATLIIRRRQSSFRKTKSQDVEKLSSPPSVKLTRASPRPISDGFETAQVYGRTSSKAGGTTRYPPQESHWPFVEPTVQQHAHWRDTRLQRSDHTHPAENVSWSNYEVFCER